MSKFGRGFWPEETQRRRPLRLPRRMRENTSATINGRAKRSFSVALNLWFMHARSLKLAQSPRIYGMADHVWQTGRISHATMRLMLFTRRLVRSEPAHISRVYIKRSQHMRCAYFAALKQADPILLLHKRIPSLTTIQALRLAFARQSPASRATSVPLPVWATPR